MKNKPVKNTRKIWFYTCLSLLFWIGLWQLASTILSQEIFLVSPGKVFLRFLSLLFETDFWKRIAFSMIRILCGFFLSGSLGCLLAFLGYHNRMIRELLKPFLFVLKTIPVASFIILALLAVSSRNLSILIAFLMCLPVFYTNILQGMEEQDQGLLEMAQVFRLSTFRKLKDITFPQLKPYLFSAFSLSMGYAFKAGIAAEILGIPSGSLGEKIYEAKLYFQTADLFAYTLTIILLSVGLEKLLTFLFTLLVKPKNTQEKGGQHP